MTIAEICQLYRLKGDRLYDGEAVSQLEHGLQCAALAAAHHQPPEMIVACLLHDMGHLVDSSNSSLGINVPHECCALPQLRLLFPPSVTEPIRLHVAAKRYLCAVEPSYWHTLSDSSKQSLLLQGDRFSIADAQAFIAQPFALEAVQLRQWDDRAKEVGLKMPDLEDFVPAMIAIQVSL
jgi:phosphonate degradation associated HDIG domain protein